MRHSLADLIEIVYRYFPRNLVSTDPGYEQTAEWERQKAARIPASAQYEAWRSMLRRLRARFPSESFPDVLIDSECYFLQSPTVAVHQDRCFTGVVWLPPRAAEEKNHRLVFVVSFVVPYYALRSECHVPGFEADGKAGLELRTSFDFSPDEAPFAHAVAEEIRTTFPGHEPIDPRVGLTTIPDVMAGGRSFGEATVFTCLFSDSW